ncbi:MAG: hypothetical protein R3D71_07860 [Rickettsiales bacterium]
MDSDKKNEERKGVGASVAVAGQGMVDGMIGTIVGAGAGAAAGALLRDKLHDEEAHIVAKRSFDESLKTEWHSLNRNQKIAGAAIALGTIIGTITTLTGAYRGGKKEKEADKQFNDLQTENTVLKAKLETMGDNMNRVQSVAGTSSMVGHPSTSVDGINKALSEGMAKGQVALA